MAINTIQNFVQGFSSCSWFAERSLRRKKKEYHRQSNDEFQKRMRGMGCLFFYFVFDGVSLFRQQDWCWYWTPSFRRVSNCISFVSIARNFVTCEHVVKRNVILHSRFFCVQKHLRFTPTYSKGVWGRGIWTLITRFRPFTRCLLSEFVY